MEVEERWLTAEDDGWAKLRARSLKISGGGCAAVQPTIFGADVAQDQCRSSQGYVISWNDFFRLEWDHVRDDRGRRIDAEPFGLMFCPWHHRGHGWRSDTKEHRAAERDFLRGLYPVAWAG